MEYFGSTGG